jgi:hypothetical protein
LKLVESTIGYAASHATAGVVPASVAALSREVLHAMLFHKIKALAAGSVALGLLGVGVVWAQDPVTPQPAQSRDDDRLREVERKLDRVLEALGNSSAMTQRNEDKSPLTDGPPSADVAVRRPSNNRPTAARPQTTKPAAPASTPYDITVGRYPATPAAAPLPQVPAPPTTAPPSTTVYAVPPHPPTPAAPSTPSMPPYPPATSFVPTTPVMPPPPVAAPPPPPATRSDSDRLSRVERRLAAIEQRIAAMEQRLNRNQPPEQVSHTIFPDIDYTTSPKAEVPIALPTPVAVPPVDSRPPSPVLPNPDDLLPLPAATPRSDSAPSPARPTDAPPPPDALPTESAPRPVQPPVETPVPQ